jgi:HEAT repeat protein
MTNTFKILLAAVLVAFSSVGCAQARPQVKTGQLRPPKEPPTPPAVRNVPVNAELKTAARAEINTALASSDPFIRAHAVEAAQNSIGAADKSIYLKALKDSAPQVRFAAAMAVGRLKIAQGLDQLKQMINDEDQQVGIAVRFALHRLGNKTYSKELQVTARDPQWQIRASTAMVLGLLEEPTATRVLLPMLNDTDAPVRLQAAEALWQLKNDHGLRALVAGANSGYADDQMISLLGLAAPRDSRVLGNLRGLLTINYDYGGELKGNSAEVGLVAARAVGMCGSDEGYVIAVDGTKSKDPRQRLLGALALGAIGRSDAQDYLKDLLKDRDSADVRLSAAQAILQLKQPNATARGE